MIGVYKVSNKVNGKCYIGISVDIENRWKDHKNPYNWKRESKKLLYQAIQKYGLENFTFEVLEECKIEELGVKEEHYISLYNSYHNGYNATTGGETNVGESHPNHKMNKEDIIDIRTRYKNLERKKDVYELYKDKIGESGFHKIWNCETWKGLLEEVYTPEIKQFHKNDTAMKGSSNGRARLNETDVKNIRIRRKQGEKLSEVYLDYKDKITYGSFTNIWTYQNWKNIIV